MIFVKVHHLKGCTFENHLKVGSCLAETWLVFLIVDEIPNNSEIMFVNKKVVWSLMSQMWMETQFINLFSKYVVHMVRMKVCFKSQNCFYTFGGLPELVFLIRCFYFLEANWVVQIIVIKIIVHLVYNWRFLRPSKDRCIDIVLKLAKIIIKSHGCKDQYSLTKLGCQLL